MHAAGYCAAYGAAMQEFLGSDEFGFSIKYKAGELLLLGRVASGASRVQMLLASTHPQVFYVTGADYPVTMSGVGLHPNFLGGSVA